MNLFYSFFLVLSLWSCGLGNSNEQSDQNFSSSYQEKSNVGINENIDSTIYPGAENVSFYLEHLKDKKVAIVGNHTSQVSGVHLVDTLMSLGVKVVKVFAPEHGFRGKEDAGKSISNNIDQKTGLPIFSLYGKYKKPTKEQLSGVDVLVFDIQDVGVRFYTYISTLHYVMEACAENKVKLIVLDRPNPNAHYVDGPVLEKTYSSFVGMHPVPIIYGMTIGEYARMINGERWLKGGIQCNLEIIKNKNYNHQSVYHVPIPPSPNLKSDQAIALYPSLCLFEGTTVSVGRGTNSPFEHFGHPKFPKQNYKFKPQSIDGASNPLHKNIWCYGFDLSGIQRDSILQFNLDYLIEARTLLKSTNSFINRRDFFNKLAGNKTLGDQLLSGLSESEIRASWQSDLENFKKIRAKYLIYD